MEKNKTNTKDAIVDIAKSLENVFKKYSKNTREKAWSKITSKDGEKEIKKIIVDPTRSINTFQKLATQKDECFVPKKFSEWMQLREERDACYHKVKSRYSVFPSAYASGALVKCRKVGAKNWGNKTQKEQTEVNESKFKLEKERGLKGWFDRNKGVGWIDCKASKKGDLVPCGRKKTGKGAEREYPACRPTLSACNKKGKKRKKSSKRISWE
jgi:hypothetical protein